MLGDPRSRLFVSRHGCLGIVHQALCQQDCLYRRSQQRGREWPNATRENLRRRPVRAARQHLPTSNPALHRLSSVSDAVFFPAARSRSSLDRYHNDSTSAPGDRAWCTQPSFDVPSNQQRQRQRCKAGHFLTMWLPSASALASWFMSGSLGLSA